MGALAAALTTRPRARDVQATVRLRVYYTDVPQGEPTAARVYLDARSLAEVRPNDSFSFPAAGTAKRLAPGGRDFLIQPLDRDGRPAGAAQHQPREWPRRDGGIVEFEIRRAYARPR